MIRFCFLLLFALSSAVALAQSATSFPLSRVRLLEGPFQQRQELHRTGYLASWDVDRLLYHYRAAAGMAQPAGVTSGYPGWDSGFIRGHMAGHYLSAASQMYAATGDHTYRDKALVLLAGLKACQTAHATGHLAAFPESVLTAFEAHGIDTDIGTTGGIAVPYYTIHKVLAGLIDAYRYLGHSDALAMAVAMSDHYAARMAALTPAQIEKLLRTDTSRNPITEYGGMSDALTELAQITGHARHRELARIFLRDWFTTPLVAGQNRLYGLHANTHVAQSMGMARYAKDTGDVDLMKAAEHFWSLLAGPHAFVTGGNSFNEWLDHPNVEAGPCIHNGASLPHTTAETCNTHNMLKLTRQLFESSPQARYADYFERALYNHILSSIDPDSGRVTYFHPHQGNHKIYIPETDCCAGTGIENTARYGEGIYFHKDNVLWVNLYIPSELNWLEQGLQIRQTGNIPYENTASFIVLSAATPVYATLNLRVPSWIAGDVVIRVNGQVQEIAASPSRYVAIERTWSTGDTVTITLPAELRVEPSKDVPSTRSVSYGPLVMAAKLGEPGITDDIADKNSASAQSRVAPPLVVTASSRPSDWLKPEDAASLQFYGYDCGPASGVSFAPLYTIHHQKYAVYFPMLDSASVSQMISFSAQAPSGQVIASNTLGTQSRDNVIQQYVDSDYVAGDNGMGLNLHMLGQSFTTEVLGANQVLSTISVQSTTTGWRNYGGTLALHLFEVTNAPSTGLGAGLLIQSWTFLSSEPSASVFGGGEWMTFDLSQSKVVLKDHTVYAFTFSGAGTGSDLSKMFFEWNGTANNAYVGGQAISQDVADQPGGLWFGSGAANTGDRVFQVTTIEQTVSDYEVWAGTSGYHLVESPDGDDDKDGLTNREEYAFGLDPTNGSSNNPIVSSLDKKSGQFTYIRRDPATKKTGLDYSIWTSSNLIDWNLESDATAIQTASLPNDKGIQSVVVTLTPPPSAPKLFIQIRAR